MVKAKEFEKLKLLLKMHFINNEGELLSSRSFSNYKISLYNMGSFLVEVWYSNSKKMVEKVQLVKGNTNLDLYV